MNEGMSLATVMALTFAITLTGSVVVLAMYQEGYEKGLSTTQMTHKVDIVCSDYSTYYENPCKGTKSKNYTGYYCDGRLVCESKYEMQETVKP